ncbi:unnamed protein product [Ambrosiozyma monospora]|uniref:Unnamed protein product n=1 Tax=Ambrosiozyma monospora TaxID=43982 RepID=A0A9W7DH70_AMBMO|nr:unnamed protein product [Ambrosiozyma monospora]
MISISEEEPTLVGSGSGSSTSPSPTSTNSSSNTPKKKKNHHVLKGKVAASEEPTDSIAFGNSPSLQALSEILNHKVNKKQSMTEIHSIEEEEEDDEDDDLEDEDFNDNDNEFPSATTATATATTITTVTITDSQLHQKQQQKSNSTYSTIDASTAYDSTTTTTTNNSKGQSVYSTYSSTNASTTSFYTAHSQDAASVSASVSLSDNVTFGRNSISGLDDSDLVSLGSTIKSLHDANGMKDHLEGNGHVEMEAQFVKMKMGGFVTASSCVTVPNNTSNSHVNGNAGSGFGFGSKAPAGSSALGIAPNLAPPQRLSGKFHKGDLPADISTNSVHQIGYDDEESDVSFNFSPAPSPSVERHTHVNAKPINNNSNSNKNSKRYSMMLVRDSTMEDIQARTPTVSTGTSTPMSTAAPISNSKPISVSAPISTIHNGLPLPLMNSNNTTTTTTRSKHLSLMPTRPTTPPPQQPPHSMSMHFTGTPSPIKGYGELDIKLDSFASLSVLNSTPNIGSRSGDDGSNSDGVFEDALEDELVEPVKQNVKTPKPEPATPVLKGPEAHEPVFGKLQDEPKTPVLGMSKHAQSTSKSKTKSYAVDSTPNKKTPQQQLHPKRSKLTFKGLFKRTSTANLVGTPGQGSSTNANGGGSKANVLATPGNNKRNSVSSSHASLMGVAQSPAFSHMSNGSFSSFGSHFRSKSYGDFEKLSSSQQHQQQQQQQTQQQQLQQKSQSQPVQQESNKFNKKTTKEKKERKEKGRSFFSSWKRKSMSFGQPLDANNNNNNSNTTATANSAAVKQHKHTFSSLFRTKSTEQLNNHAKHQSMPLLSSGSGSAKPTSVPAIQTTPAQQTSRKSSLLGTYGFDDAQTAVKHQGLVLSTPIIPSTTTSTPLGLITPSSASATATPTATPATPAVYEYGVSKVMAKARAHTGTSGVHKHTEAELYEASPFEQPLRLDDEVVDNEEDEVDDVLKPSLTPVQEPVREVFSLSENVKEKDGERRGSKVNDNVTGGDENLIDSVVARGANVNMLPVSPLNSNKLEKIESNLESLNSGGSRRSSALASPRLHMGDSVFPRSLSIEEVHSIVTIERSKSTRSIKSLKNSLAMAASGSGVPRSGSGSGGSGSGSISGSGSSRSIVEMLKNGDHDEFDELVIPDGSGRVLVRSPSGHSVKLSGLPGIGANGSGLKSKRNSILKNRQFDSSTSLHSIIESESRIGVSKLAHTPASAPINDDEEDEEEEEDEESDHDVDIDEPEVDYIGRIGAATPRSEISAGDGCTIKGDSNGDGDKLSYEAKDVDELISMMDFSKGDEELDTEFDMDVNIDSPNADDDDDDDLYSIYDNHKKVDAYPWF